MKRFLLTFLTAFTVFIIFTPSAGSAVEMSAGVYTWYAWWDFPEDRNETVKTDPSLVYGPVFSANFSPAWSLTFVFLYGKFNADGRNPTDTYTYDITRYDCDTALNYKINPNIKVYFGLKYSRFTYDITAATYTGDVDHVTFGPGAGLSFTLPVAGNLFLIGNAGGLYMWGTEKYTETPNYSNKPSVKDYGYNSGIALAYYIEPASTTLNLGGRFQYIKSEYDDGFTTSGRFYGITLSAAYMFSL